MRFGGSPSPLFPTYNGPLLWPHPHIWYLLVHHVNQQHVCFLNPYGPILMPGTERHAEVFEALPLKKLGDEGGENRAEICEQVYEQWRETLAATGSLGTTEIGVLGSSELCPCSSAVLQVLCLRPCSCSLAARGCLLPPVPPAPASGHSWACGPLAVFIATLDRAVSSTCASHPASDGEWRVLNLRNWQDSEVRRELRFQTGEQHKQNT